MSFDVESRTVRWSSMPSRKASPRRAKGQEVAPLEAVPPEVVPLVIEPLTPDRWNELAALFEEGGDPKWCWCMYWRLRSKDFAVNRAAANREGLRSLTDSSADGAGPAPGLIGYQDGRAVGWV